MRLLSITLRGLGVLIGVCAVAFFGYAYFVAIFIEENAPDAMVGIGYWGLLILGGIAWGIYAIGESLDE